MTPAAAITKGCQRRVERNQSRGLIFVLPSVVLQSRGGERRCGRFQAPGRSCLSPTRKQPPACAGNGCAEDFGLTPAEAAVAVEVLGADGLQAAAGRLGISLATARTHLAHVFDKTGTRRQAELVRVLLRSQ